MNRLQSRCIVWLTQLIGDILGVDDVVVAIKYKDGSLEQTPLLEPHTVALAKLLTPLGRERLVQHALGILEARLHLWGVHTHGIDAGIGWQGYVQGFPLSRHA